ncbi:ECF transporter S component [Bacillota bacterium LX-D]|nr:ECF transporter S component [Bacillota bacterium LX-D]
MRLATRKVAISGLLGAITVVLGATPLGFIPVPTPAGHATIMHIPVIIGGILEGPIVGLLAGLIFGMYSLMMATAFFSDPIVAILPRLLIGIIAYLVYRPFKNNPVLGGALAAAAGTATNTIGVLSLAVLRGYLPSWKVASVVVITHGLPEMVLAILIVSFVIKALAKYIK